VGLEALARVVGRQKQMAYDIGSEVESQNGLFSCAMSYMYKMN